MSQEPFDDEYVPRRLHRKPRRIGRVILVSALLVLVTIAGVGMTYATKFSGAFNSTQSLSDEDAFPTNDRPVKDPGDKSMNILLLGADGGKGEPNVDPNAKATDRRADSMMLVHIPADRKGVYVMSIMRDTWVDIPGHGHAKINSAISSGGVPLLVQTLEGMFKAKIDHVAIIDFQGFRDLTKAVGGVTVHNDQAFTAADTDYFYPKGDITVEGDRALRFVRERHAFVDGDYQRVRNQQKFLKALFKKVLSPDVLSSPNRLYDVVESIAPYVTLDSGFRDPAMLVGLAMQMRDLRANSIYSFTLPNKGTGWSPDHQSIVLLDQNAVDQAGEALRTDTMAQYYAKLPKEFKKE